MVTTELGSHPNQIEGLLGYIRIANRYMTIHTTNHVIHHCRFFLMNAVTVTSFYCSLFYAIEKSTLALRLRFMMGSRIIRH